MKKSKLFESQVLVMIALAIAVSFLETSTFGGNCPGGVCPSDVCPGGVCPDGVCPDGVCPDGVCPGGVCPGGVCPVERKTSPHPAVVRVVVETEESLSYGSGTWVHDKNDRRFVLTCAHLFGRSTPNKISVRFPDTHIVEVQLLAIDHTWDLAVLNSQDATSDVTPIEISTSTPLRDDTLHFGGYGKNGVYHEATGKLLGYCRVRDGKTNETLVISGTAQQGDSGGPIFNTSGQLVGILWGTDNRTVCGTYNGRILRFLETAFPPSDPFNLPQPFGQNEVPTRGQTPERPNNPQEQEAREALVLEILETLRAMQRPNTPSENATPQVIVEHPPMPESDRAERWIGRFFSNFFLSLAWVLPPGTLAILILLVVQNGRAKTNATTEK